MFTEEMAIALLREKHEELGRLPKKEDFSGENVSRIKSKLGPWPRALEAAGLKGRKENHSLEAKRKKKRLMRKKTAALANVQNSDQKTKE